MDETHGLSVFEVDGGVEDHAAGPVETASETVARFLHEPSGKCNATQGQICATFRHACTGAGALLWLRALDGGEPMKKLMMSAIALMTAAGIAAADPLEGLWQTEPDDGAFAHVQIEPCGANFCGKIVRSFKDGAEFQSPNRGKTLVIDMAPQGGGNYEGKVWRPSNDKIYLGKIALNGDSIKLRGCIAGGLLCSKQTWARVN
jgi:uncharacterized protein (DUF2147 family)